MNTFNIMKQCKTGLTLLNDMCIPKWMYKKTCMQNYEYECVSSIIENIYTVYMCVCVKRERERERERERKFVYKYVFV